MCIRKDLSRLARFGANIADAYSCFILLPFAILRELQDPGDPSERAAESPESLGLAGHHSLSNEVIPSARIEGGIGLIGWVSKHNRSIHVSPFERDSRTLGVYREDQHLKSFIGIPVLCSSNGIAGISGVIACDSKKSFAFSKLQGKLLEDLATEVSNLLGLKRTLQGAGADRSSWQGFIEKGMQLAEAVGPASVEVMRLRMQNFGELEASLGSSQAIQFAEQTLRLIHQAVPPHFPSFRSPSGDLIFVMDNMMTALFENKVRAICKHASFLGNQISFQFSRRAYNTKSDRTFNLDRLVSETAFIDGEREERRFANFG